MAAEAAPAQGGTYEVHAGDVSGQFVVGSSNTVTRAEQTNMDVQVGEDQRAVLSAEFERVRSALAELGGERSPAVERLGELEESVASDAPDVSLMVYVRNWFLRTLPAMASTVTGLIIHPVVGQLVQQAGDHLVAEYDRHFGALRAGGDT